MPKPSSGLSGQKSGRSVSARLKGCPALCLQFSLTLSLSKGFWELSWLHHVEVFLLAFERLNSQALASQVLQTQRKDRAWSSPWPPIPSQREEQDLGVLLTVVFVVFTRPRAFRNSLQTGRQEKGQDLTIQVTRAPWVQRSFASRGREPGKTRVCSGPLRGHHGCFLYDCLPHPSAPKYFHDGYGVATRAPGFPFRCAIPEVPGK